jgi:hypothetical protein
VVQRVIKVAMIFYSGGGWESGGPGMVACDGGVDSML